MSNSLVDYGEKIIIFQFGIGNYNRLYTVKLIKWKMFSQLNMDLLNTALF